MDWQTTLALAVPALVAVTGYIAAYVNNLRLAQYNDRLARINQQLSEFYGPLLALTNAARASWDAFRVQYRPDAKSYWGDDPAPTEAEAEAWRLWMSAVFMPLNRQMRDIVVSKTHLINDTDVRPCLLELCAHVAAYETVLERWEKGDFAENVTTISFP